MADKPCLLVSACLLGVPCRYDGQGQAIENLAALMERFELIPVCPEQLGGLPTPRTPAEIRMGRVINRDGADVTDAFRLGAERACRIAESRGARLALLKSRSPSCGRGRIYDGSFSGRLTNGNGVACAALKGRGITIYREDEMDQLLAKEIEP